MEQIDKVAEAGADLVRVAVPRDEDAVALRTIVERLADPGDRRHPLQPHPGAEGDRRRRPLHPAQPGQHRRPREGRRGGRAGDRGRACRCGSASTPARCPSTCTRSSARTRSRRWSRAAVEFVEMMESLDFEDFKVSIKSTNVPNTIAANRLLAERIPYPIHLGITEAGTKWSGSLKSAVGLGTLLADGVGDTIRISLSTFHAEEEVKVAWEILKALQLRERGPVLIACPTCGRLQFDMDSVVAEIETPPRGLRGADRGRGARLRGERDRRGLARRLRDHRRQERGPDLRPRQAAAEGAAGRARRRAVRRDRQVARPRRGRGRRREGGRGRRVAGEDRGGERRRADPGADRGDGGREGARGGQRRHRRAVPEAGQGQAVELDEEASPTAGRRFTRA